jgi:hypothetical protein
MIHDVKNQPFCSQGAVLEMSIKESGRREDSAYRTLPAPMTAMSSGIRKPAGKIKFMEPMAAGWL